MAERGGQEAPEPFSPGAQLQFGGFLEQGLYREGLCRLSCRDSCPREPPVGSNPERIRPEAAHQDV